MPIRYPIQVQDADADRSLPLGVVIGADQYAIQIARLLGERLADLCDVARFPDNEEAALGLACPLDDGGELSTWVPAPVPPVRPVAFVAVIVGDETGTADQVLKPLVQNCQQLAWTRLIVLSTSSQISGVDWLTDSGRLDWIGYAPGLATEPFIDSMKTQVKLFDEHRQVLSAPQISSLFDQPFSDAVIIEKVLRRIELSLGVQPRITLPPGVRLTTKGEWVEEVTIILSGSVALIHESPNGDIVMHEESTGRIIGLLAVSEGRRALLNAITTSEVTVVRLTVEQLNIAINGHPDITLLVATLFIRSLDRRLRRAEELHIQNAVLSEQLEKERAQLATALVNLEEARTELSAQERLASLGALSAGVAHELNNPMAAIQRIAEYLGEDVTHLLQTAPDKKWAKFALTALQGGLEAPSLSTRAERKLRRELAAVTGDKATAQRLSLAGIRDLDLAKQLKRRSGISLEGAEQAASIGTQLRNLRSASVRITDLVSSLRSYARPDGESAVDVDLHGNLDDAIRLLSHKLGDIDVSREYDDLPTLECHPGQLAQVWTNLLTNAAEAIAEAAPADLPAGQKLGHIKIATSSPRPGWLRVEIADDGPGIPESILPRIFEPRFTTKSGQVRFGMGVGLGVSRNIVGKHYGTMRIRTSSEGTTVVVDLPVTAPKEEQ